MGPITVINFFNHLWNAYAAVNCYAGFESTRCFATDCNYTCTIWTLAWLCFFCLESMCQVVRQMRKHVHVALQGNKTNTGSDSMQCADLFDGRDHQLRSNSNETHRYTWSKHDVVLSANPKGKGCDKRGCDKKWAFSHAGWSSAAEVRSPTRKSVGLGTRGMLSVLRRYIYIYIYIYIHIRTSIHVVQKPAARGAGRGHGEHEECIMI